jgi:hypothetical protein
VSAGAIALVAALVLTSLGAVLICVYRLGLPPEGLRHAAARVVDCIGLGLVFLAANLVIGGLVVLALRIVTDSFVSLYVLNDDTILALSLLQGLVVQWWRQRAR